MGLEAVDLDVLLFAPGVTRMDKIRNDYNRRTTHVRRFRAKQEVRG